MGGQTVYFSPPNLQLRLKGRECHVRARTVAADNIRDEMDRPCNAAYQVMAPLVMWLIAVRAAGRVRVIQRLVEQV